jgi:6-pyruvoyl-tetrahydropterin synthase
LWQKREVMTDSFSAWEHTSTAFGEGRGCNFKVRVGAPGSGGQLIQKEAHRLSRIIDHVCLEKDIPYFRSHSPTIENIARFLCESSHLENAIVEVDGGDCRTRARAQGKQNELIFSFSARNARRVFQVEVTVGGFISPVTGMVIDRIQLQQILRQYFEVPELIASPIADNGLERTFSALKATLLPRKLSSIVLRDAIDNRVLLRKDVSSESKPIGGFTYEETDLSP